MSIGNNLKKQAIPDIVIDESNVKWFKCNICDFKNRFKSNFISHFRQQHPEINTRYMCSECAYEYKAKEYLKRHAERDHTNYDAIHGYVICRNPKNGELKKCKSK